MTPAPKPNLEELRRLEREATPAPWKTVWIPEADNCVVMPHEGHWDYHVVDFSKDAHNLACANFSKEDADLLRSARNALPWLLRRAELADRYAAALRGAGWEEKLDAEDRDGGTEDMSRQQEHDLLTENAALRAQLAEAQSKNRDLNRRCQAAESAMLEKAENAGPSMGRALANAAASEYKRKLAVAEQALDDAKMQLIGGLRAAEQAAEAMQKAREALDLAFCRAWSHQDSATKADMLYIVEVVEPARAILAALAAAKEKSK